MESKIEICRKCSLPYRPAPDTDGCCGDCEAPGLVMSLRFLALLAFVTLIGGVWWWAR